MSQAVLTAGPVKVFVPLPPSIRPIPLKLICPSSVPELAPVMTQVFEGSVGPASDPSSPLVEAV